jgi:hypothetical protein
MAKVNVYYLRTVCFYVTQFQSIKPSCYSKVLATQMEGSQHKGQASIHVEGLSLKPHRELNPTGKRARKDKGLIQITDNPYFR